MAYGGEIASLVSEYRDKGRKEAAALRPPTDALHPDQHEVALRGKAKDCLNTAQKQFNLELGDASRVTAEVHTKLGDLENKIQQLLNDSSLESAAQVMQAEHHKELAQVVEGRIRAEVQLRDFRAKNQISEEAHYPDSHVWHFAIIALCFLGETTANALFFSNAAGLLAGYTVAVGLAAVNIASATVLGMFFRYKNLSAPEFKLTGWLSLALFVVLSVYLNALFSSYRTEYQLLADPTDVALLMAAFGSASAKALTIFILGMHIADLTSFLLFGFGIFLSGLAFWKGYTYDDKYPDHGRLHRHFLAARDKEAKAFVALREGIAGTIHEYRGALNSALNEPGQLQSRCTSKIAAISQARATLGHEISAITNDYNLALDAYRQQNTAIRGTEPPTYFRIVEPLITDDPALTASPRLNELESTKQTAVALRERFQDNLNRKIEETNGLASKLLTTDFEQFTRQVEEAAKESITRNTTTIHRAN